MISKIHADMIAGHKAAIAALEQSIAAREAKATLSCHDATIHVTELRQLEALNTELMILEAKYGKA